VRGFVGFPQKSAMFVGDFSLVPHDPKGSHYKVFHQERGILHKIMKKSSGGSGEICTSL